MNIPYTMTPADICCAILARIDGEYDQLELRQCSALSPDTLADVKELATEAMLRSLNAEY